MRYFCTYFDQNYLARALVLIDSLKRHSPPFKIFVLCLDEYTFQYLSSEVKDVTIPIRLSELEENDAELKASESNRSRVEYFFTLSPCWPLYILKQYPEVDMITYLDSDLYFFSNLDPIYNELGSKSIYITSHRFPPQHKEMDVAGKYNVGFQIFRKDKAGLACLERWRSQCIEWCYDKVEENRYADQKYLDEWIELYKGDIVVSANHGANLAPWNVAHTNLTLVNDQVMADGVPLVFYHFHRLRFVKKKLVTHGLETYHVKPGTVLKNYVYAPYIGALIRKNALLNRTSDKTERLYRTYSFNELKRLLKKGHTFYYFNDHSCFRMKWSLK